MKAKHAKTLQALFDRPARANIPFAEIEALAVALGGKIIEREGSRIAVILDGAVLHLHRPHPSRQAKKHHVEAFRAFFEKKGITP